MLIIRTEQQADIAAVREVNLHAFPTPAEADLVDRLRERGAEMLSLVAELDGQVVGHILFSPVLIGEGQRSVSAVGLGPMAVLPEFHGLGIGSRLVREGLEQLRAQHYRAVIVLGHAEFYPRFGFVQASRWGIRFSAPVPDEAFMALELQPGALKDASGVTHYQPEFEGV